MRLNLAFVPILLPFVSLAVLALPAPANSARDVSLARKHSAYEKDISRGTDFTGLDVEKNHRRQLSNEEKDRRQLSNEAKDRRQLSSLYSDEELVKYDRRQLSSLFSDEEKEKHDRRVGDSADA